MKSLRGAKRIIEELNRNGHEAYIVGGAVRDHLLKMPLTDIDITTNAKPFQVAKLFKTKPTGLRYGTVTVFIGEDTYEVTTYRIDGAYLDGRHPESVLYSESVVEDVSRRDFTINGLLMTPDGDIIDHVGGQEDLKKKLIRTIGDPHDRFNEDALRIMRAFYFQAKLGFQIDKDTRDAIMALKERLKDIAMERIMTEIIKMLKGSFVKRAIQSMVTTGVHEVLPGLKDGLLHIVTLEDMPYTDVFFTLCFALHGSVPGEWPFSNKHRHRYEIASELVRNKAHFDPLTLYTYGLDLCLLANRVSFMLGWSRNLKTKIESDYAHLPLQSDLDLRLRASDILKITQKKAGAWLKQIQTDMVVEILNHRLKNEKEPLEAYVRLHVKE